MTRAGHLRSVLLIGVPLLLVVGLGVAGFALHVQHRQHALVETHLRALATLAHQVESGIGDVRQTVDNAVHAAATQHRVVTAAPPPPPAGDGGAASLPGGADGIDPCPFSSTLRHKLALVPGVRPHPLPGTAGGHCAANDSPQACLLAVPRPAGAPQTRLAERGRPTLADRRMVMATGDLILCTPLPHALLATSSPGCGADLEQSHTCAAADLDTLLAGRIAAGALDGVDVFLSDGSGRILYQRGSSGLRLAALAGASAPVAADGALRLPAAAELAQSTAVTPARLNGKAMLLLTQPVQVPTGEPQAAPWILGALLPAAAMGAQTSVSFAMLAGAPMLLVLALLALPFLTWATLGPRDALRRGNALAMLGAAIAGTALLTALAATAVLSLQLAAAADGQLARVSAALQEHFADELRGARRVLRAFVAHREEVAARTQTALASGYVVCRSTLGGADCAAEEAATPAEAAALLPALRADPHVEMLVLAAANGQQYEKWTIRPTSTAMIDIGALAVFRDAREGRFLPARNGALPAPSPPAGACSSPRMPSGWRRCAPARRCSTYTTPPTRRRCVPPRSPPARRRCWSCISSAA